MLSTSYHTWMTDRSAALDEIEAAHRSVGGTGRGRRYATQQINQAYAVLLSSQFQGFCRDLHSECIDHFLACVPAGAVRVALEDILVQNRKLDRGNPSSGNIGSDYNRFGITFWHEVKNLDVRNDDRQIKLDELNLWRNAIAHQDFDLAGLGTTTLHIRRVREWRRACDQLAVSFDQVMGSHFQSLNGAPPW